MIFTPKKKNLTSICPVLILLIVCSFCVCPGSGRIEDSPYITINPVGDHAVGDIINISGTTNFPVNTTLWIQAGPKEFTKYPPHYIGEKVQIVQGTNSNYWSIKINSSTFTIDEYNVLVSPLINDSSIFSYARFNMTSRHTSTLQTTSVPPTTMPEWTTPLDSPSPTPPIAVHWTSGPTTTAALPVTLPVVALIIIGIIAGGYRKENR